MGVFKRVSDIMSANLNDVIETWEEPEQMLRHAVREMEVSIERSQRSVARAMASHKLVAKELATNQQQAEQWQARAESAVAAGNDALALKALAKKQEHEKLAAALRDQHASAVEATDTLRRQLEEMRAKLADAKRRLGTLTARKKAADLQTRVQLGKIDPELNTDAFAKFDRFREKVERAEAEADALRELASGGTAVDESVATVPDSHQLELGAELAELKQKLAK
jgi:phage shock protein A